MPGEARIVLQAPAKINLHLSVGDVREDGFHDVETVLHALDLCDTVVLERSREVSLACDTPLGITPHANLAVRAARDLASALGRPPGVRITLKKRIPSGAGLGGASADAAAVLTGLPDLWGADVPHEALVRIAEGIGADVPFFLRGGTAWYTGRGDAWVESIDAPVLEVALIKPRSPVSTARAYEMFDRLGDTPRADTSALVAACGSGEPRAVAAALFNNMTEAAEALVPEIADVRTVCDADPGVYGSLLAGSGSTVFAVCESASSARRVAARAEARGWWACATRSREGGVRRVAEGSATDGRCGSARGR